jgi:hypothetical protein
MSLLIAAVITVVVAAVTVVLMILGVNVVLLQGLRSRIPQAPAWENGHD